MRRTLLSVGRVVLVLGLLGVTSLNTAGCTRGRYQLVSQEVAAAAAEGFPSTEAVRGRVYRLDRETGEVIMIGDPVRLPDGTLAVSSFRVLGPEETAELLNPSGDRSEQ